MEQHLKDKEFEVEHRLKDKEFKEQEKQRVEEESQNLSLWRSNLLADYS